MSTNEKTWDEMGAIAAEIMDKNPCANPLQVGNNRCQLGAVQQWAEAPAAEAPAQNLQESVEELDETDATEVDGEALIEAVDGINEDLKLEEDEEGNPVMLVSEELSSLVNVMITLIESAGYDVDRDISLGQFFESVEALIETEDEDLTEDVRGFLGEATVKMVPQQLPDQDCSKWTEYSKANKKSSDDEDELADKMAETLEAAGYEISEDITLAEFIASVEEVLAEEDNGLDEQTQTLLREGTEVLAQESLPAYELTLQDVLSQLEHVELTEEEIQEVSILDQIAKQLESSGYAFDDDMTVQEFIEAVNQIISEDEEIDGELKTAISEAIPPAPATNPDAPLKSLRRQQQNLAKQSYAKSKDPSKKGIIQRGAAKEAFSQASAAHKTANKYGGSTPEKYMKMKKKLQGRLG